ncbi:MAG: adenosine deaminase [Actinobacteria bacterium]|nr:adenosine deaminase [Actinomycetota bacterium]
MGDLAYELPKAELHLHLEGTLEPELLLELATRNHVRIPWSTVEEVRAAFDFEDLGSFLEVYESAMVVLRTDEDFAELTSAYIARAAEQGVRHAEVFFDPQIHLERGVAFPPIIGGIDAGLRAAEEDHGVSTRLIMCFLRDRPAEAAMDTLELALDHIDLLDGVGLDSAEFGNPPSRFDDVFARARYAGLVPVAHAGEEGPPAYVREALDRLLVQRIDHGIRAMEDDDLVQRLVDDQIPLTVCPLSNVALGVVARLEDHPLPRMLEAGLKVTVNSDDPAFFGGYIGDNYAAVRDTLALDDADLVTLARNSVDASLLDDDPKEELHAEIAAVS